MSWLVKDIKSGLRHVSNAVGTVAHDVSNSGHHVLNAGGLFAHKIGSVADKAVGGAENLTRGAINFVGSAANTEVTAVKANLGYIANKEGAILKGIGNGPSVLYDWTIKNAEAKLPILGAIGEISGVGLLALLGVGGYIAYKVL